MKVSPMIPLFSASAVNAGLDLAAAVTRVIDSNWYVLGSEVSTFEQEFARYVGAEHCVSVANGTDALQLGLQALGVGPGDFVACVANAGFYSSTAIHAVDATPLYVDVDPRTLNMSAESLKEALKLEPKAVIVTHLYGQMADIETLAQLAREASAVVLEDCAQAHGARRAGRRVGSIGDVGCFSFYPTKNLGALGDGGAVVCRDPSVATTLRSLRQYGWSSKYAINLPHGRNSRLDEMQAAVLRDKLPRLDGWNAERRHIASQFNAAFAHLPMTLPASTDEDYVAHLYVVQIDARDAFREHLRSHDVATDVHYPIADHRQRAYPDVETGGPPLKATEAACERVVSLPCFPGMTKQQVAGVIDGVRSYFGK